MKNMYLLFLAVLSGILLSLAWPCIGGITPLLFVGFVPLLFVEQQLYEKKSKSSLVLFYAYLCFLIWNILTTWWIYFASPEGMVFAIILNAFFMAIVFWLFHITKKRTEERRGYISLIVFWIAWEYLHLNWDLTWPWLTLGNGFANQIQWIQWYEYTGVFGGSLWVLIVNILLFRWIKQISVHTQKSVYVYKIIGIVILLFFPIFFSKYQYNQYEEKNNPVNIVILQPNIDPYLKFEVLTSDEQLAYLLNMADSVGDDKVDYFVAPETAIPKTIWENDILHSEEYPLIKNLIYNYPKAKFVLGSSTAKAFEKEEELSNTARKFKNDELWYDSYNTAMQIDTTENIQLYHKSKLVPGVEKMPFPSLLKPLEKLAIDLGGTTGSLGIQEERGVFVSPNSSCVIAPVICYESVYGEFVGEYVNKGANLIFIITNDGWWEDTPGYKQHLAYARLRAIETRRSIARSANTGISCFIDQKGELFQLTKWWKATTIRQSINKNFDRTFYTKYGDYIARVSLFVAIIFLLWMVVVYLKPPKIL